MTIHPFDDGNGRIARGIADWALARSENSPQRFHSMSAQIQHERNTALRDIQDLIDRGILKKDAGGGRSTSYSLAGN